MDTGISGATLGFTQSRCCKFSTIRQSLLSTWSDYKFFSMLCNLRNHYINLYCSQSFSLPRKVAWPLLMAVRIVEFLLFSLKVYTYITEKLTNIRISFGIRCYDATLVELFLFVVIILVLVWHWIYVAVLLMMGTWSVFRVMAERIWSSVVW
jgi:hypothetical protein